MTINKLFLAVVGISAFVFMAIPMKVNAVPPGYVLAKADEFNGNSLDTSLWIPYYLECRTTKERAAARYSFKDGCLVLKIDYDQPTYYSGQSMKVSSIQTGQRDNLHKDGINHSTPTIMKYTPQYGYFEIRSKNVNQSGYHVAFWTVGRRDQSWQEAEIDIMEQYYNSTTNFNLIRWSDNTISANNSGYRLPFDPSTGFHTYGLEWDSKSIKYYVDGSLKKTTNQSPSYPAVFFLGIYENSGWNGSADRTQSKYPREFYIDYFRAYTKGTNVTPTPIRKPGISGNSLQNIEVFNIKGSKLSVSKSINLVDTRKYVAQNLPIGIYLIRGSDNKIVERIINP